MRKDMSELTPRQRAQILALENLPDDQIDMSEIPETLDWSNAVRGMFYRPGEKHVGRAIDTTTDTSERALEDIIFNTMICADWLPGESNDYNREYCVDLAQLSAFLRETQIDIAESLALDGDGIRRQRFLTRLKRQISDRGVIDVLRNGVRHGQHNITLFYETPTPGNERARALNVLNRFSVTRQLHYSRTNPHLSLDLALFINGLPVATFELKNQLTKQTVADAEQQYKDVTAIHA